jgi:macrodomain Ter protein organizer (MatP/YcbG family)
MATVTARKVDDADYALLSEVAQNNGRSISEEVRSLIAEAARKRKAAKTVAEMRAFVERNPLKLPDGMTSLDLLREERDSW